MKKIISLSLLFLIVFSSNVASAANDITLTSIDVNKSYKTSELQEIAISNSRQALADDMDIKKKEMAVRTVTTDINAMSDSILSVTKPIDVQLELDSAKKTKQDHLNQLKTDVYKAVINVLLCDKEIALQQQKLAIAEEQLTMAKSRFKAATITQDDLDSAQYNVDDRKVNLSNAKEKLDSLYLDLKKLINQPLNVMPIKINGEIKQEKFDNIDIDILLDQLYESDTSVYKAAGKLKIAQKAMDIAEKLYKKGDQTYDSSVLDLEETEYDLTFAKNTLEVRVRNAYNDMINKLDDMELSGKYTALASKKLSNSKLKLDKGTISKDEYFKAKETLLDAQFAELSSITQYNCARADLENIIGVKQN